MPCDIQVQAVLPATVTDDFHCGYSQIDVGEEITISANKQMVCFGVFVNNGILNIDGAFILEP